MTFLRGWLTVVALALALALFLVPREASAEPPSADQREMSRRMHRYFDGELGFASAAFGLSAASGWAGGMLLVQGTDATRAAAVPVILVGVGELAIGLGLFLRTPAQVRALDARIAQDPEGYVDEEGARMEAVVGRFGLFTALETTLLFAGTLTTTVGAVTGEDRAIGAGLGTAVQATVALTIDALAASRAERYLDAIRRFQVSPTIQATGPITRYGVAFGGAF
ncbi:MAG: hypothetical protein R3B72_51475 [Polyangiaceae bacterium]